jgi:hypothetical protein
MSDLMLLLGGAERKHTRGAGHRQAEIIRALGTSDQCAE